MPRIQQPYYNTHQILTGQYTDGDEFVLSTGEEFVGGYHVLPTGQRFSEFRPTNKSVELFEKKMNPTQDILRYNQITGNQINKYVPPISYQPIPTTDDYKKGKFDRFFVQKRNSPLNTIVEIDGTQFNQVNVLNNPGINGVLWNRLQINWKIGKIPKEDAYYLNQYVLQVSTPNFPGIGDFVQNPLEFYQ
jgi:hypothetical protein